jgi:hypothetical protein
MENVENLFSNLIRYGILQEQNWLLGYTDPLVPIRQSQITARNHLYPTEDNLAHYIDVLRNQEQCSYIIIIAHLGLSQQIALANKPECEGVNYILGGDTHEGT